MIAAAAGGAGVLGTNWVLTKLAAKIPQLANPYVAAGVQVVAGTILAGLVGKYTRNRTVATAIAFTSLGVAGASLIDRLRQGLPRGTSGVGELPPPIEPRYLTTSPGMSTIRN